MEKALYQMQYIIFIIIIIILAPDQDEWVLLGVLLRLLVPFEHVTTELCGQYVATNSKVSVVIIVQLSWKMRFLQIL